MRIYQRSSRGFTLIELAVVIAIVGLLVGGMVASYGAIRINTKIKETQRAMEHAELLLQAFLAREGRLPCPANPSLAPSDVGYGEEHNSGGFGVAGAGGGCHDDREFGTAGSGIYWGTLPAQSLGARVNDVADGWDTQLFYVITGPATLTNAQQSGNWQSNGGLALWDDIAKAPGTEVINDGVMALVSVGANRNGGYTLDGSQQPAPLPTAVAELENGTGNFDLIMVPYSDDPDAPFDDVVRVYREDDLAFPLALSGEIEGKLARSRRQLERLVGQIYAIAAADATHVVPTDLAAAGVPLELRSDAWGANFQITVPIDGTICREDPGVSALTAGDELFTLSSPSNPALTVTAYRGEALDRIKVSPGDIGDCP